MSTVLAEAITQERWELAALCLLLGLVRTVERLPPDALPALLELLGEPREQR